MASGASERLSVGAGGGPTRTWGVAILVGLAIAVALLLIPRSLVFTPAAEDACAERGAS